MVFTGHAPMTPFLINKGSSVVRISNVRGKTDIKAITQKKCNRAWRGGGGDKTNTENT